MPPTRLPSATYRIQLNQYFRFADTLKILDYLHDLGVTDLYLSPILAARKGSTHGYDLIDPSRINPEIGTEEEFNALQTELQNRGMGLLLDIVPNHMAASAENPWWMDVLENGAQSAFAGFFDIEWHTPYRNLEGRILLPVLGRPFGEALESGEIKLIFQDGRFFIQYFESLFPVAPRSYHSILNLHAGRLKNSLSEESAAYHEYSGILAATQELARGDRRMGVTAPEQRMRFESTRDRIRAIVASSPEIARLIEENVAEYNGRQSDPRSFGIFQRLLGEQNYKLSFWRNLNDSINYRRFFTIADLVGVRVEDPIVFEASHGYILRLVSRNPLAGLRIDHIDGLRDPATYLNRLQERLAAEENRAGTKSYVIVEKILAPGEDLPEDWPVNGTTGYDFTNAVNSIFVNPDGTRRMEEIYSAFIGRKQSFADVLYQKKKLVMSTLLGVEMRTLGRQLAELAAQDRYARELDRPQLINALIEVTACLGIYRTYIRNVELPPAAMQYIEQAVAEARTRAPHLSAASYDFVREVLLLENPPQVLADEREARLNFVMRWQQFTGPIVAKGFEDTALYVYHPLLSLNEVGGNPRPSEAHSLEDFYEFLEGRRQRWPGTLDATTTHDTKRSEDVRARLNVLSEIPDQWQEHLAHWAELNAQYKEQNGGGQSAPDRNEEYFLYQTLLGVWALDQEAHGALLQRVQEHLIKATREAMVHTRWTRPNEAHEKALTNFAAKIVAPENTEFINDFREFQKKIAYYGMINGLSQTLVKIASPGVADFYQGSDLWDLRMVDPDNRGAIDFGRREAALRQVTELEGANRDAMADIVNHWCDGRTKLYLIRQALRFRREHAHVFHEGEFIPLQTAGCHADNVIAFLRRTSSESVLIAAPRWPTQLVQKGSTEITKQDWCDTRIVLSDNSPHQWTSVLSSAQLKSETREGAQTLILNDVLRDFPVALLSS